MYCWKAAQEDRWSLVKAYREALPPSAVFVGRTAAWIHRIDVGPANPVEVALPADSELRSRAGLQVRHCDVSDEVELIRGIAVTRLERTLLDLCARLPRVDALSVLDMALCARLTTTRAMRSYGDRVKGRPGSATLRALVELAAPAESPMETRLRWLLIAARLPKPEVQVDLYNDSNRFLGRADLFYPTSNLVIEFDGGNHRDRLVGDNRRQNSLTAAGYRILRFTGADLRERPDAVTGQVRRALIRVPAIP